MKAGYLSEYFTGVAMKILSAVEADAARTVADFSRVVKERSDRAGAA
jgi:hypothetical protein